MIHLRSVRSAVLLIFCFVLISAGALAGTPDLPAVAANENRTPAGELKDGQLTLHLDVQRARWYPDGDSDPFIDLHAFAEMGKRPQIPAPLIRVREVTKILAIVRNLLPQSVLIHGLHERPGNSMDVVEVPAGEAREFRFAAGSAGTYTYWASTSRTTLANRPTDDSELSGAFVVDPPGKLVADRIFVLGLWLPNPPIQIGNVASINGKSWPHTERLSMQVGETASWRVVNGSGDPHAMHLHGFRFRVDSEGDGEVDRPYATDTKPFAVTQQVPSGGTMAITWIPERAGNWMFHCHMTVHMSPRKSEGPHGNDAVAHDAAAAGMSGLVLGIRVTGAARPSPASSTDAVRHLQLRIFEREAGWPPIGLELREAGAAPAKNPAALLMVGPPIVLTRGQPAEIVVLNTLKQPTAIHWHGMALESVYDGVPGFSGDEHQTAPAIEPGGTFVAKMTPPQAGTYIYHTHWHDDQQIVNGLYGPLIVLEPGQIYDAEHDRVVLFSFGKFLDPLGLNLLINGTPQPLQVRLHTGEKYRFRLINITANAVDMQVSLFDKRNLVEWRKLAKDGLDLPAARAVSAPAQEVLTVGETRDFEFQANRPMELELEALLPRSKRRAALALVFEAQK